jgi:hypothetical protein
VSSARNLSGERLTAVTDGNAHVAADGLRLGLVDGISSFADALTAFVSSISTTPANRRPAAATGKTSMKIAPDRMAALIAQHTAHAVLISSMAAGNADSQPASEADIVAAIEREGNKAVKADLDRISGELAKAKTDHATAIAGKDAEIADLKAKLELAKPKGVEPLRGGTAVPPTAPTAIDAYNAKIAELKASGDKTPADTVARKFPTINQAFITAVNAPKKEA